MTSPTPNGASTLFEAAEHWCVKHIDRAPTTTRVIPVLNELDSDGALVEVSASSASSWHLRERAWPGTKYQWGVRHVQRAHPEFDRSWVARGTGFDHGKFHELFTKSVQYQRAVNSILYSVKGALWQVRTPKTHPNPELADIFTEAIHRNLFEELEGGFADVLGQAVVSLCVNHFAIFEIVDSIDGSLRKLAFRRPNTVHRWILNDQETELLGVEFTRTDGTQHFVDARHLLLVCWQKYGMDFEGLGPMRSAAPWILAKHLAGQIWLAGMEKYGTDIVVVERAQGSAASANQTAEYQNIWEYFSAEDFPLITLQPGDKATRLGVSGSSFDYEAAIRYFDEQILMPLSADSALVGLNRVGAYNVLQGKESEREAVAVYLAAQICDAINGTSAGARHSGVIRRVTDHRFGGPVDGVYSKMHVALGDEDSPLELIFEAARTGEIDRTDNYKAYIADRLGVPQ